METIQKWKEECRMRNIKRLSNRFEDKNYMKGGADDDDDDDDDDEDDDDIDVEEQNLTKIVKPNIDNLNTFSMLKNREIGIGNDIRNRNRRKDYINLHLLRPNPKNQAYLEDIQNNNRTRNRFLEIPVGEIEQQNDQNPRPRQRRRFNE